SSSIVAPALTRVTFEENGRASLRSSRRIQGAAGPTDVAVTDSGSLALVVTGNAWTDNQPAVIDGRIDADDACELPDSPEAENEPVAVAFDARGQRIVQSREPARLSLEDG